MLHTVDDPAISRYDVSSQVLRDTVPARPSQNARSKCEQRPTASTMPSREELLEMGVLYRFTIQQLETFKTRVAENKDLDAANDFARYVLNSGMLKIMARYDNGGFYKVDSAFVRYTAEDLRRSCCEKFRGGKVAATVDRSTLESIHRKLDLIAGELARQPR